MNYMMNYMGISINGSTLNRPSLWDCPLKTIHLRVPQAMYSKNHLPGCLFHVNSQQGHLMNFLACPNPKSQRDTWPSWSANMEHFCMQRISTESVAKDLEWKCLREESHLKKKPFEFEEAFVLLRSILFHGTFEAKKLTLVTQPNQETQSACQIDDEKI